MKLVTQTRALAQTLVAGRTPNTDSQYLFTTGYTRNPDHILAAIDTSAWSFNDGVLVGDHTILFAWHKYPGIGWLTQPKLFVDGFGGTHSATINSCLLVNDASGNSSDIGVGKVNSTISVLVNRSAVVSANFRDFAAPVFFMIPNTASVRLDGGTVVFVEIGVFSGFATVNSIFGSAIRADSEPPAGIGAAWFNTGLVSGDSGFPVVIIATYMPLIGMWDATGAVDYASYVGDNLSRIQAVMNALGTGDTLAVDNFLTNENFSATATTGNFSWVEQFLYTNGQLSVVGAANGWIADGTIDPIGTTSQYVMSDTINGMAITGIQTADGVTAESSCANPVAVLALDPTQNFAISLTFRLPSAVSGIVTGSYNNLVVYLANDFSIYMVVSTAPGGFTGGATPGATPDNPVLQFWDGGAVAKISVQATASHSTAHTLTLQKSGTSSASIACDGAVLGTVNYADFTSIITSGPFVLLDTNFDPVNASCSIQLQNIYITGALYPVTGIAATTTDLATMHISWSAFSSVNGTASTYAVSLDGAAYSTPVSGLAYTASGASSAHTITVRPYDAGGKLLGEGTGSYAGPGSIIGLSSATNGGDRLWTWTAYAGSTSYSVSLNGAGFTTNGTNNTYTATGKAHAGHTLAVRAFTGVNIVATVTGSYTVPINLGEWLALGLIG